MVSQKMYDFYWATLYYYYYYYYYSRPWVVTFGALLTSIDRSSVQEQMENKSDPGSLGNCPLKR